MEYNCDMKTRLLHTGLAIAFSVSIAQAQPNLVDVGENPVLRPPDTCHPPPPSYCCIPRILDWSVSSGPAYLVNAGTVGTFTTPPLRCDNCRQPNCRKCDSSFPMRPCNAGLGLTVSISASATLHGGLSVGASEAVKLSLGATLGVTIGTSVTLSVSCPIPTPPCSILEGTVTVTTITGKRAAVDHDWTVNGVWRSRGVLSGCGPGSCSAQGDDWTYSCEKSSSFGIAEIESFSCDPIVTIPECKMLCMPSPE